MELKRNPTVKPPSQSVQKEEHRKIIYKDKK